MAHIFAGITLIAIGFSLIFLLLDEIVNELIGWIFVIKVTRVLAAGSAAIAIVTTLVFLMAAGVEIIIGKI